MQETNTRLTGQLKENRSMRKKSPHYHFLLVLHTFFISAPSQSNCNRNKNVTIFRCLIVTSLDKTSYTVTSNHHDHQHDTHHLGFSQHPISSFTSVLLCHLAAERAFPSTFFHQRCNNLHCTHFCTNKLCFAQHFLLSTTS